MRKLLIVLAAMLAAVCMIIAPAAAVVDVNDGYYSKQLTIPGFSQGASVYLNVSVSGGAISEPITIYVDSGIKDFNMSNFRIVHSEQRPTSLILGGDVTFISQNDYDVANNYSGATKRNITIQAEIPVGYSGFVNISGNSGGNFIDTLTTFVISVPNYKKVTSDMTVNVVFNNGTASETDTIVLKKYVAPYTPPSSGGSTDTGSGHFTEYPRSVTKDNEVVSFGSSDTVTSMILPDGTVGEVTLKTVTDAAKPEGYYTYKQFEIIVPGYNYDSSEPATISFKIKLSDLAAAGFEEGDVLVLHGNDDATTYVELDTYFLSSDGVYAYYAAETYGASPFAIVFEDGASITENVPQVTYPTDVPTNDPVYTEPTYVAPTESSPAATATQSPLPILGLLAGLAVAGLVLSRK